MSDDEIRVVIAEKCGWTKLDQPKRLRVGWEGWANCFWQSPQQLGSSLAEREPPDYPNDLNACHEFEKTLTAVQWNLYTHFMEVVTRGDIVSWLPGWMDINPSRLIDACLVHSTARQRCEAFLRTFGLWKDNEKEVK